MMIVALYSQISNFRRERRKSRNRLTVNINILVFAPAHQVLTVWSLTDS